MTTKVLDHPAKIIDGKEMANQIRMELRLEVENLLKKGIQPGLAVILVGNDQASHTYVNGKEKASKKIGLHSEVFRVPDTVSENEVLGLIHKLNQDSNIHGILVQLPLPRHISERAVIEAIDPEKDVDGFHPQNVGKMALGIPTFLPCTPHGVIEMLTRSGVQIEGKHAVVVGHSNIVGKPMAQLLLARDATVSVCHKKTVDLAVMTKQADILVVAVGKPDLISGQMVKAGAVVIDVGINRVHGKLVGDCNFKEVSKVASMITPVPGGVGPMTITMLLYNTVHAAKRLLKYSPEL